MEFAEPPILENPIFLTPAAGIGGFESSIETRVVCNISFPNKTNKREGNSATWLVIRYTLRNWRFLTWKCVCRSRIVLRSSTIDRKLSGRDEIGTSENRRGLHDWAALRRNSLLDNDAAHHHVREEQICVALHEHRWCYLNYRRLYYFYIKISVNI